MPDKLAQSQISAKPFQDLLVDHSESDLRQALVIATNADIPPDKALVATATHPLETRYEAEKRQGLRRTNGARKLKKLSNRHLKIIGLHLEGKSGEYIADAMRVTFITVSRVLNDPLATNLISTVYRDRQGEIDALAGKAVDAVRNGLGSDNERVRLTAVGSFAKLKETIGKEETSAKTAEDVVAEIFSKMPIGDTNIQVNIGKDNG